MTKKKKKEDFRPAKHRPKDSKLICWCVAKGMKCIRLLRCLFQKCYMIHEHNKPWKACNLRTVAQQNLLQKDGKQGMRAGGLDIPPVSHPPPPLCVGLGPPRYPLLGSQSPKWKVPGSDRIHWTCGELGLSDPFHPREPVWKKSTLMNGESLFRNVRTHTKTTVIAATCELREDKDIHRVCAVLNKASHIEPDSCTQSKCKAIQTKQHECIAVPEP